MTVNGPRYGLLSQLVKAIEMDVQEHRKHHPKSINSKKAARKNKRMLKQRERQQRRYKLPTENHGRKCKLFSFNSSEATNPMINSLESTASIAMNQLT